VPSPSSAKEKRASTTILTYTRVAFQCELKKKKEPLGATVILKYNVYRVILKFGNWF